MKARRIESAVVPSAGLSRAAPRSIDAELRQRLADGARLLPAGSARKRPRSLLRAYPGAARLALFDATFYLSEMLQNEDLRFFVAYVVLGEQPGRVHPRIFYKDVSLVWRSASHVVQTADENWVGKGALKPTWVGGEELLCSAEETTDLPLEIQTALERACRRARKPRYDRVALTRVLRNGPSHRTAPYADFTEPRRRAASLKANLVNGGRRVARFTRRGDPTSLRVTPGFEPDFRGGILEHARGTSRLYGGRIRRFRIVSRNREVQYCFFASPRAVWIGSLQATTTELSSFGLRTIDVEHDDELLLPAYEYHFRDDDGEWVSQIPEGFAGAQSPHDDSRADTTAWLDRVPLVRRFRREVLGQRPTARHRPRH